MPLKIQLLQSILNIITQESKTNMGKIGTDYGHKTTPTHTPNSKNTHMTTYWFIGIEKYSIIIDFGYHQMFKK